MRSPSAWAGYLSAKEYHITFFQNCCHFLYDAPFTNNFLYIFYVYTFNVSKCIENYTLKLPYIISLDLILNTITFYVALPSYLNKKKKTKTIHTSSQLFSLPFHQLRRHPIYRGSLHEKKKTKKHTHVAFRNSEKSRDLGVDHDRESQRRIRSFVDGWRGNSGHIRYQGPDEGFSDVVSGTLGTEKGREAGIK